MSTKGSLTRFTHMTRRCDICKNVMIKDAPELSIYSVNGTIALRHTACKPKLKAA
jgi:hypothetical protein